MKYPMRIALALGFLGAAAMAAAAFAEPGSAPEATAVPGAQAQVAPEGPQAQQDEGERPRKRRARRLHRRMVHSETKVQTQDGFALIIADAGKITAVDGNSVTIERADGEKVTVTATDQTRIRRNGEKATVGDLQVGDNARIMQIQDDEGRRVRGIIARTPRADGDAKPSSGPSFARDDLGFDA